MRIRRAALIPALVVVVVATGGFVAKALGTEARLRDCGVGPDASIRASYTMAHASEYAQHFPSLPHLPELDGVSAEAYVLVINGPIRTPAMGPTGASGVRPAYTHLVCVVVGGFATVYPELELGAYVP